MPQPPATVTVTIASPDINTVYSLHDSILVKGTAISAHTLHGYNVVIKSATDTTVYFSQHVHDHNDTLVLNHKWKGAFTKGEDLEAQVSFVLDHNGNTFTKTVPFKVR